MNDKKNKNSNSSSHLIFIGVPTLLAICCGLPTLFTAIGLTTLGAFLVGKEVWEFGVILILVGMFVFIKNIKSKKTNQADCEISSTKEVS